MRTYHLANTGNATIEINIDTNPEIALQTLLANCGNYKAKVKLIKTNEDTKEHGFIVHELKVGNMQYYSLREMI